ncbi:Epithelial splicing regulatory protein 1 [Galdieria sulphuraria]|nr:Epithelial splicing regulatory protein 1 [Galdieria sulphuraria]
MERLQPPYRYLIILDLEATAVDLSKLSEQEIIEWPWAVYDIVQARVLETQVVVIKGPAYDNSNRSVESYNGSKDVVIAQNLREAVLYFDNFIFEKFSTTGKSFCLLTDGPWDLRHLLLVEASRKNIKLAHHYRVFFDLRVEFRRCFPQGPIPRDRQIMTNFLDIPLVTANNGLEDCYSIAAIITQMLLQGYVFSVPELISNEEWFKGGLPSVGNGGVHLAVPLPAIPIPYDLQSSSLLGSAIEASPVAAGVPTGSIIRLRGLPWSATKEDVLNFLEGAQVIPCAVHFVLNQQGKPRGEAFVQLLSVDDVNRALELHRQVLGHRYIEVFKSTPQEMSTVLSRQNGRSTSLAPFSRTTYSNVSSIDDSKPFFIIRMRGLPFSASADQVARFFDGIEIAGCRSNGGIHIVQNQDGHPIGEAFVEFASEDALNKALQRHKQMMGKRYIELFRSSLMEMLNTIERHGGPVARAAIEATVCENSVGTSSRSVLNSDASTCSFLRIRGLPFDTTVSDITTFFAEYRIVPGGIYFVNNGLDRPKGEAFVQFSSVDERNDALKKKDKLYMGSRYVELFEASEAEVSALLGSNLCSTITSAASSIANSSSAKSTFSNPNTKSNELLTWESVGRGWDASSWKSNIPKSHIIPNRTFFFSDFHITESDVVLGFDKMGRPSGEAWVTFGTEEEARNAVSQLQHAHIGKRYIELFLCTQDKSVSLGSVSLEGKGDSV